MDVLILQGQPACSKFSLDKRRDQMGPVAGGLDGLYAEFVHLLCLSAPLTPAEQERAQALLRYGPQAGLPEKAGREVGVVVPRLGTISPWSSKATDIFSICGLNKVLRVERGVRWFVEGNADVPVVLAHAHDRMTERVITDGEFDSVFDTLAPQPLATVGVLAGGRASLDRLTQRSGWPSPTMRSTISWPLIWRSIGIPPMWS